LLGVPPDHPTYIRQAWQDYPAADPPDVPNFFTRVNSYTPKIYEYQRSPANLIYENNFKVKSIKATGPVSVVYSYLPPGEQAPNPNGEVGLINGGEYNVTVVQSNYLPRWKDDDPYDFTSLPGYNSYPISGENYTLISNASTSPNLIVDQLRHNGNVVGSWSFKASVDNLQSRVVNRLTGGYEYYDYKQKTFEYEQTGVVGLWVDYVPCCWNEGMTITGKVSFKSIPFTTEARPEDNQHGYGFGGMILKVDGDFSDAGEADWTVTLTKDFPSGPLTEIEIPATDGVITVISDFWITDIIDSTAS
jgi:hypothetical protein